jgi:predicted MFS family arabinose efflux permease
VSKAPGVEPVPSVISAWAPFAERPFLVIWTATVIANIGSWMYNVASGWLMLSLDPSPLMVSMVQVANALPMFLFAVPAGALIDIVDRRRFLIVSESAITLLAAVFAALVWANRISTPSLLGLSFLIAVGSAFTAPAWQAVVGRLVPKAQLPVAVAANSVGINVSRAVGPALGGALTVALGIGAPFWVNAFSNVAVIFALIWWRPSRKEPSPLPAESFGSALRTGIRHALHNPNLQSTLVRAVAFFFFASAYWALLPLVANGQLHGGPALYGMLLGAIGAAAITSSFFLRWLRLTLGANALLAVASLATGVATSLFAVAHSPSVGIIASLIAGTAWIAAVSSLNISAQVSLPDWVRGRGLAMYVACMFGSLTLGSAVWGEVAALAGPPTGLLLAAVGTLVAIPLTWRWKVQGAAAVDLSPSHHWPILDVPPDIAPDRGPLLVTIEYCVEAANRDAFLRAMGAFADERKRDGAYDWQLFEDPAAKTRFLEIFFTDSLSDHLRQHERVTHADEALERIVQRFHSGEGPHVRHLIAISKDR